MDVYREAKYGIDRYGKQQPVTTEKRGYVDKFWTDGIKDPGEFFKFGILRSNLNNKE